LLLPALGPAEGLADAFDAQAGGRLGGGLGLRFGHRRICRVHLGPPPRGGSRIGRAHAAGTSRWSWETARSRRKPTRPMMRMATTIESMFIAFHSFHTKVPMPRLPTIISAAMMTSHAVDREVRRPVTMAGTVAGRVIRRIRRSGVVSKVRARSR